MCQFFSVIQSVSSEGLIEHLYSMGSDSHTVICKEHHRDQDKVNQFEINPDTGEVSMDCFRRVGTDEEAVSIQMCKEWFETFRKTTKGTRSWREVLISRGKEIDLSESEVKTSSTLELWQVRKTPEVVSEIFSRRSEEDLLCLLDNSHKLPGEFKVWDLKGSFVWIAETFQEKGISDRGLCSLYAILKNQTYGEKGSPLYKILRDKILLPAIRSGKILCQEGTPEMCEILTNVLEKTQEDREVCVSWIDSTDVMHISDFFEKRLDWERYQVSRGERFPLVFPFIKKDPMVSPSASNLKKFLEKRGVFPLGTEENLTTKEACKRVGSKILLVYLILYRSARRDQKSWIKNAIKKVWTKQEVKGFYELIKRKIRVSDAPQSIYESYSGGWGNGNWRSEFSKKSADLVNSLNCGIRVEYTIEVKKTKEYVRTIGSQKGEKAKIGKFGNELRDLTKLRLVSSVNGSDYFKITTLGYHSKGDLS